VKEGGKVRRVRPLPHKFGNPHILHGALLDGLAWRA